MSKEFVFLYRKGFYYHYVDLDIVAINSRKTIIVAKVFKPPCVFEINNMSEPMEIKEKTHEFIFYSTPTYFINTNILEDDFCDYLMIRESDYKYAKINNISREDLINISNDRNLTHHKINCFT